MENGKDICAVFFDYRKAFGTVPHQPLLAKLEGLELSSSNLLAAGLPHLQESGCNCCRRNVRSPSCSVPRGLILGPLLFLIYINDLPGIVCNTTSSVNLFADDILLYHVISSTADYATLQDMVSCIEHLSASNYLHLHPLKCKYMTWSMHAKCGTLT